MTRWRWQDEDDRVQACKWPTMPTLRNWLPSSDSQWHQQMWLRLKSRINCCVISHLKVISWNWFCLFHLLSLSHNEKLFCSKIFPSYSEMMTRMCESLPALWEEVIEYLWGKKQKHILEQRGNSKLIAKSWLEFHPWPFPHPHSVKSIWRRGGLWRDFGDSLTHFYPNLKFCKKSPENTDRIY